MPVSFEDLVTVEAVRNWVRSCCDTPHLHDGFYYNDDVKTASYIADAVKYYRTFPIEQIYENERMRQTLEDQVSDQTESIEEMKQHIRALQSMVSNLRDALSEYQQGEHTKKHGH